MATEVVAMPRAEINPTRLIHYEHPERKREAWCGAPVEGVYAPGTPVQCSVCADLWEQHWRSKLI